MTDAEASVGARPRPRRRLLPLLVGLALIGLLAAALLIQVEPAERPPHFERHTPANIAHAGAQGHAPANTLEAFELALELGADTLEMDLQLTADDEVVVHHDGTVDRQTDGSGAIREMTLAELKALDAGHAFEDEDGEFPYRGEGLEIPTLEEVFEAFPQTFMILELKPEGGIELVAEVADRIEAYEREDSVVVASFDLEFVQRFRQRLPGVPTNMPEGETRDFYWRHLVGLDRWYEPPGELFQVPEFFNGQHVVTANFVAGADRHNLDVQVWTINEPAVMNRLLALGVHGVMTGYPDRLAEVIRLREAGEPIADHPGLTLVRWLQQRLAWLTPLMGGITVLGDEEFYVLVFPLLFWAVSQRVGLQVGLILLISAGLNGALKLAGTSPRPGFIDPGLERVAETSFGIPSGHAQNGVAVWGLLAAEVRRRWAWAVAAVLMLLLGWSRVQLGVHFLQDVLVGWLVGAALLMAFLGLREPVTRRLLAMRPAAQVLTALGASVGLLLIGVLARLSVMGWMLPTDWIGVGAAGWPVQLAGVVTAAGALFGVGAGVVWQRGRGGFSPAGPWPQRLARCLLGLVGVALIWEGLGQVFPAGEDPVALAFRYLRYAAVGFWVGGAAPRLFVRLRLARGTTPVLGTPTPRG